MHRFCTERYKPHISNYVRDGDQLHLPFQMEYHTEISNVVCFQVASWTYSGAHVRLENGSSEIDLSMYNENGQWHIEGTSLRRNVIDTGEAIFDSIIMEVRLQRKPVFYLLNVIVPCTVS